MPLRNVRVKKAGVPVGDNDFINFIEGANITITVTDDPANDETDITITGSGGGISAHDHTSPAGDGGALTNAEADGYIDWTESAAPSTPAANHLRMWAAATADRAFIDTKGEGGITLRLARDNVLVVKGGEVAGITKGQLVYISGSSANIPTVKLAKADAAATMPSVGIALEAIAHNDFGIIMLAGRISGVSTVGMNAGDPLYVSAATAGAYTTTKPSFPNIQQRVAYVLDPGASSDLLVSFNGVHEQESHANLSGVSADQHHAQSHGNADHTSTFITAADVTYENLSANGDIGTGATQVSQGDHSHAGAGHVIADAGVPETQRATLDFQDGFIVTDNAGANSTDVDLDFGTGATQAAPGNHTHAGGAGPNIEKGDTLVTTAATVIDFDGTDFDVTDSPTGEANITIVNDGHTHTSTSVTTHSTAHAHADLTSVTADQHHAQSHTQADHTGTGATSTQAFGDVAADGTGTKPANMDHKHGMPANPVTAHEAAGDPHTGYRLESADHSHQSTGLQAGQLDHGLALTGLTDDDHPQYQKEADWTTKGDLMSATGAGATARLGVGTNGQHLEAASGQSTGLQWASQTFTIGATILSPSSSTTIMAWRAPYACTVTNVRCHFKGGTSVVYNAQKNQASTHLSSNQTNSTANAWADGGAVQNTAYAAGDDLELMFVTINGSVTEASIQVDFTRP